MNLEHNPIVDLRKAVLSLDYVPSETPVEPSLVYGAPSMIAYDANAGVIRVSVGWGNTVGRPSMGQLRAWLGLPPDGKTEGTPAVASPRIPKPLTGAWAIARGTERFTWLNAARAASALVSGYHGVRRNGGSLFWGLVWFAAGAWLPGVAPLFALGQGYAQCHAGRGCPRD